MNLSVDYCLNGLTKQTSLTSLKNLNTKTYSLIVSHKSKAWKNIKLVLWSSRLLNMFHSVFYFTFILWESHRFLICCYVQPFLVVYCIYEESWGKSGRFTKKFNGRKKRRKRIRNGLKRDHFGCFLNNCCALLFYNVLNCIIYFSKIVSYNF